MTDRPQSPSITDVVSASLRHADRPFRYLSVCSDIEAASVAWHELGWESVAFAEIDPFCSALLAHHYPDVPNLGDFTQIGDDDVERIGKIDLLVGGTPCFPAGTTVLTRRGFVDIAAVIVGDEVLTHLGRWRRVTETMHRESPTVILRGQGHPGLVTTAGHPFYARTTSRAWEQGRRSWKRVFSDPAWVSAAEMVGHHWASPAVFPEADIPPIIPEGRERAAIAFSEAFFWIVGAWLGDGWVRDGQRSGRSAGQHWGQTIICTAHGAAQEFAARLDAAGFAYRAERQRTTTRFIIHSGALTRWLTTHFGQKADGKRLPTWALGMAEAYHQALLDGYTFADGFYNERQRCLQFTSIGKTLLIGIKLLGHTLGYAGALHQHTVDRTRVIEGRRVQERPSYILRLTESERHSTALGGMRWGLVRELVPTQQIETVYNLEVDEDHSYVADGIVVHNCQDFSVAGQRAGLDGNRGILSLEFARLADRLRPTWICWENVPGVLSAGGGRDFAVIIGGLTGAVPAIPTGGWRSSGVAWGPRYGLAWRVFDAQFFGVPQRRRRVFIVGHLGSDWRAPTAILLEPDSLSGNPPPRRAAGQGAAAGAQDGAGSGGGNRAFSGFGPGAGGGGGGGGRSGAWDGRGGLEVSGALGSGKGAGGWGYDLDRGALIPETVGTLAVNGKGPGGGQSREEVDASYIIPETVGTLATNAGPRSHDAGNFHSNQAVDAGYIVPQPRGMVIDIDPARIDEAAPTLDARCNDGGHPSSGRVMRKEVGAAVPMPNPVTDDVARAVQTKVGALYCPGEETCVAQQLPFGVGDSGISHSLQTHADGPRCPSEETCVVTPQPYIVHAANGNAPGLARTDEVANCIHTAGSFSGAQGGTVVAQPTAQMNVVVMNDDRPAHTLRGEGFDGALQTTETVPVDGAIPLLEVDARINEADPGRAGLGIGGPGDPMFSLQASHQHGIAHPIEGAIGFSGTSRRSWAPPGVATGNEVAPTLNLISEACVAVMRGIAADRDSITFQPRFYSGRPLMSGEPSDVAHPLTTAGGDAAPHIAYEEFLELEPRYFTRGNRILAPCAATARAAVACLWNRRTSTDGRANRICIGLADNVSCPLATGQQHAVIVATPDAPAVAIRTAQTGANGHGIADDVAHALDSQVQAVAFAQNQRDEVRELDVAGALSAETGTHQTTYVAQRADPFSVMENCRGDVYANDVTPPLTAGGGKPGQSYPAVVVPDPPADRQRGGMPSKVSADIMPTLRAAEGMGRTQPMAAQLEVPELATFQQNSLNGRGSFGYDDQGGPTRPITAGADRQFLQTRYVVRRLTPGECEALQGFPRGYTDVPYRGRPAADGNRYKALGNSMAVPVMHRIGRRIKLMDGLLRAMASGDLHLTPTAARAFMQSEADGMVGRAAGLATTAIVLDDGTDVVEEVEEASTAPAVGWAWRPRQVTPTMGDEGGTA